MQDGIGNPLIQVKTPVCQVWDTSWGPGGGKGLSREAPQWPGAGHSGGASLCTCTLETANAVSLGSVCTPVHVCPCMCVCVCVARVCDRSCVQVSVSALRGHAAHKMSPPPWGSRHGFQQAFKIIAHDPEPQFSVQGLPHPHPPGPCCPRGHFLVHLHSLQHLGCIWGRGLGKVGWGVPTGGLRLGAGVGGCGGWLIEEVIAGSRP